MGCGLWAYSRRHDGMNWVELGHTNFMGWLGLLMGRVIIRVFGLGCVTELFGWVVMGLEVKWVGMGWVC